MMRVRSILVSAGLLTGLFFARPALAQSGTAPAAPVLQENFPGHQISSLTSGSDGKVYRFLYDRRARTLRSFLVEPNGTGGYSESPQDDILAPLLTERMTVSVIPEQKGGFHAFMFGALPNTKILEKGSMSPFHAVTDAQASAWQPPSLVLSAFVGSLMPRAAVQLASGRLILAFGDRIPGSSRGDPFGQYEIASAHSDDGGRIWKESNRLRLAKPADYDWLVRYNGPGEPSLETLRDGRVWMLLRTPTGRLYETFSPDGTSWPEPRPSPFYSSDSPATTVRLPDGAIVLLWNNASRAAYCDLGKPVYGGRDALSAAISHDDGQTWHGFREVYLDPNRDKTPPPEGDRGTAYPRAGVLPDGKIEIITGQHEARGRLIVDPRWLEETSATDDFRTGLERWHTWKAFGPSVKMWRDRKSGPTLIPHPDQPGEKVLYIRRPPQEEPDGAVWNFPAGRAGEISLRLRFGVGSAGLGIALNDCFYDPIDIRGSKSAQYRVGFTPDGGEGFIPVTPDAWHDVVLRWDVDAKSADVLLDGVVMTKIPLEHASAHGPCYLRLRSLALETDEVGTLVERVTSQATLAGKKILP